MHKKLLKTGLLLRLTVLLAFSAAIFSAKRAVFRDDSGVNANLYIIGKKSNPKIVSVTNKSPVNIAVNAIKDYFKALF